MMKALNAALGVVKGGLNRMRVVHNYQVYGPHQSTKERSRRIRQIIYGKLPFDQLGLKREDALKEYQLAVQNALVGKRAA